MNLRRKMGLLFLVALLGTALSLMSTGNAFASGGPGGGGSGSGGGGTGGGGTGSGGGGGGGGGLPKGGKIEAVGTCGDLLDLKERVAGTLIVSVTVPSADAGEVWSLNAVEQDYGATTGARVGPAINLVPNPLPQLAFSPAEGGFTTTMDFNDLPGATHGFIYTATRTSPTPLTCTNQGFWTNPGGGVAGPVAANPTGRPDSAPILTGATEADATTHDVQLQFDQEIQTSAVGIPVTSRFSVTVNGANRAVTAVALSNDNPPNKSVLDVTFAGVALKAGQTVTVLYRQPLSSSDPQLQDLEGNKVVGFGPVSVTTF